jgi:hypothetical protein
MLVERFVFGKKLLLFSLYLTYLIYLIAFSNAGTSRNRKNSQVDSFFVCREASSRLICILFRNDWLSMFVKPSYAKRTAIAFSACVISQCTGVLVINSAIKAFIYPISLMFYFGVCRLQSRALRRVRICPSAATLSSCWIYYLRDSWELFGNGGLNVRH